MSRRWCLSLCLLPITCLQIAGADQPAKPVSAPSLKPPSLTIQQAEERIKKNPNDAEALLSRAIYRTQVLEASMAVEDFNRVIKLQPHNLLALRNCSKLNLNNRQWRAAVSNLNMLEKLDPKAETFSDGGDAKFQVHDYAGASRDWLQCYKMAPEKTQYAERAGYGNFYLGNWAEAAACFDKAYRSTKPITSWPLADAAFAFINYGLAGKKNLQESIVKDVAARKPADMDLFDSYTMDFLTGKIDGAALLGKRKDDPYYRAQANFFVGFGLAARGKTKEARPYLERCDIESIAPTDDFKLPLEAIAKAYLAKTK